MNWEMMKGAIERIATVAVTYMVAKGYVPEAISADLIALLIMAASIGIGIYVNTQGVLVQAAASMPEVKRVVVDNAKLATALDQPQAKVSTS